MITVLSPAKTLDFESPVPTDRSTVPALLDHASEVMESLKQLGPSELGKLMKISDSLSTLNAQRNKRWKKSRHTPHTPHTPHTQEEARQSLFAFSGDVYNGLDASTLNTEAITFAQDHLRILSGLYGYLRPLDLIMPHRLEMGTRLTTEHGSTLYDYWGTTITDTVSRELADAKNPILLNLASQEYFKAIKSRRLTGNLGTRGYTVITPLFKDQRKNGPRVIGAYAKQQRGRMARFILENAVDTVEPLKAYNADGYAYAPDLSTPTEWVFLR
ncbi:MAG: peroxide stress protein YaaA [Alkalispirochaeta sp.]